MKLITKVILLIVVLMTPVISLYAFSHRQSTRLVEEQITIANRNRLAVFMQQIEQTMDQVSLYSHLISQDPDFASLAGNVLPKDGYEYALLLDSLQRKLSLFGTSTAWMNRIVLYFPQSKHAISSYSLIPYEERSLPVTAAPEWSFREVDVNGLAKPAFTRYFVEPSSAAADVRQASVVVEVNLMADNIVSLLDSFKTKGNNDPFLYRSAEAYLPNRTADDALIRRLIAALPASGFDGGRGYAEVSIDGQRYLAYGLASPKLGWTLIDYVPLDTILAPVTASRNLFYATAGLLVAMGAAAAFLLYTQVQVPIRRLDEGARRLEAGDWSARIDNVKAREFAQLFRQFNRMAARIQHLIEKVYREELLRKEAVMKQLQSQINPHFLYNSLAYIVSMAQMNRTEPVVSMAYSLADYYRYSTRNETLEATVRDELDFVVSYIEIMNMQLRKIRFAVDVPESLESLEMPKLLLQPLVENAIVHGLEPKPGPGSIRIAGEETADRIRFVVEDDGVGLADEALAALNEAVRRPVAAGDGRGLWNVAQRIAHRFGPDARLYAEASDAGGVKVTIDWPKPR